MRKRNVHAQYGPRILNLDGFSCRAGRPLPTEDRPSRMLLELCAEEPDIVLARHHSCLTSSGMKEKLLGMLQPLCASQAATGA